MQYEETHIESYSTVTLFVTYEKYYQHSEIQIKNVNKYSTKTEKKVTTPANLLVLGKSNKSSQSHAQNNRHHPRRRNSRSK